MSGSLSVPRTVPRPPAGPPAPLGAQPTPVVTRSTSPRADPHCLQLGAAPAATTAIAALFSPPPTGNTTDSPPIASQGRSGASRHCMESHP